MGQLIPSSQQDSSIQPHPPVHTGKVLPSESILEKSPLRRTLAQHFQKYKGLVEAAPKIEEASS